MAAVLSLDSFRQKKDEDRWRQAGYEAVDQLVSNIKDKLAGKSFEEISDLLRQQGQSLTGAILEEVLKSRASNQLAATEHVCEQCGRTLKRQPRLRGRTIESRHGEIEINRPYFYCKHCRCGYYPFDKELEIAPQRKQDDLQRAAAELFTEVPFERASQIFERLTGVKMTDHCMQELAAEIGEAADKVRVLPTRQKVEEIIERAGNGRVWRPVLVVAADGADLPTRPQAKSRSQKRGAGEWKEAKGFPHLSGRPRSH